MMSTKKERYITGVATGLIEGYALGIWIRPTVIFLHGCHGWAIAISTFCTARGTSVEGSLCGDLGLFHHSHLSTAVTKSSLCLESLGVTLRTLAHARRSQHLLHMYAHGNCKHRPVNKSKTSASFTFIKSQLHSNTAQNRQFLMNYFC